MTHMSLSNTTQNEIHPLIKERYSGLAFSSQEVEDSALAQLFEAARWAASSFNEQPWRFIYAHNRKQESQFKTILDCLSPPNQIWAKEAAVLIISAFRLNFSHKEHPNRHAAHDLGQAMANFSLQAVHLGLNIHQMAGFDSEKARSDLAIPKPFEPGAAIALGYPGDIESLPPDIKERAKSPRERKQLSELVFCGSWGKAS